MIRILALVLLLPVSACTATAPAFAQNMSQMGIAPWTKAADRKAAMKACLAVVDEIDRRKCVEAIR